MSDETRRIASPLGTHVLVLTAYEAMNSQWVEAGTVIRASDGALLVEIGEWNWHVDHASWPSDDRLLLSLRRFPGDVAGLRLSLNFAERTADPGSGADHVPFAQLSEWLEDWYLAERAKVQRR